MRSIPKMFVIFLATMGSLAGCTRSLPLMSHAHVGHTLTTWRDTPDQEGLFVVAEKETQIALEQADAARQSSHSPVVSGQYLSNVIHALDPVKRNHGNGLGYGAIRALEGSSDHIVFAAESDDASANIIGMAARYSEGASAIVERMKLATEVALLAEKASGDERTGLSEELYQIVQQTIEGEDSNGDAEIGPQLQEYGLKQLRNELSSSLRQENPPYHPIGRKYLLGLVKMPNGIWMYRFDAKNPALMNDTTYRGGY